jgi:hypothetical protein
VSDPAALAELRQQLQQALAEIDLRERALAEAMKPQTLAEVEELERKLTDALEDLQARKAELGERPPTEE